MIKRAMIKRALYYTGAGLAIFGIVFLAWRLKDYMDRLDFARFTPVICTWLSIIIMFYTLANLLMVLAWKLLLAQYNTKVPFLWAVKTYGTTQLGKYLPGNIFNFAGRQAIGMAAGLPAGALAKSSAWELGLFMCAGTTYSFLVLPLIWPMFTLPIAVALSLSLLCSLTFILQKTYGKNAARAYLLQILFLLFSAVIFIALKELLIGTQPLNIQAGLTMGAASIIAWLAGFVTPGAPAGTGIREMVLIFLNRKTLAEPDLLLIVLTVRVVSILGDMLFFLISVMLPRCSKG